MDKRAGIEQLALQLLEHPLMKGRFAVCLDPCNKRKTRVYHCSHESGVWRHVHPTCMMYEIMRTVETMPAESIPPSIRRHIGNMPCIRGLHLAYLKRLGEPDGTFIERLDRPPGLFACRNGVFDMRDGIYNTRFRLTRPDDMVSIKVGWSYDPAAARSARPQVEAYLRQVLPVDEERRAVLAYLADQLTMARRDAHRVLVIMATRGGNNGRSAFAHFVNGFFDGHASVSIRSKAFDGQRLWVQDELGRERALQLMKERAGPATAWEPGVMLCTDDYQWPRGKHVAVCPTLVVPFRAKFVPATDAHLNTEPHTYVIDWTVLERMATDACFSAFADMLFEMHLAPFARRIQLAWRRAVSDPAYMICRRRLEREFAGLAADA